MHRDHRESSDDTMDFPKPLLSANQKGKRVASSTGNTQDEYLLQPHSSAVGLEKGAGSGGNGQDSHNGGRRGWSAEEDERLKEVGISPCLHARCALNVRVAPALLFLFFFWLVKKECWYIHM